MTPRQKEFCRHYLRGLSAPKAALAAGYAKCTAERNAGDILRSKEVQRYLNTRRTVSQLITRQDLENSLAMLRELQGDADPRVRLAAGRELRQLARQAPQILMEMPTENTTRIPISCNQIQPQEADNKLIISEDFVDAGHIEIHEHEPTNPSDIGFKDLIRIVENLSAEQRRLEGEAHRLGQVDINRLLKENKQLVQEEDRRLAAENRRMDEEERRLAAQAAQLEESLRRSEAGWEMLPAATKPAIPLNRQERRALERKEKRRR